MDWTEFSLAFVTFFVSHSLPTQPKLRPRLVHLLGARGFAYLYSAMSIAVLTWLIIAAGRAPYVELWMWEPWQNDLTLLLMLLVCLVIALTVGRPNPLSFGGMHNERFEPDRAGIVRLVRHPWLAVLALWSFAHLIANGDLAHFLLFGVLSIFASLGGVMIDKRKRRELGTEWNTIRSRLKSAPLISVRLDGDFLLRASAGILLYGTLIWLHPMVIGVDPLIGLIN